jgi:hypothetical protein
MLHMFSVSTYHLSVIVFEKNVHHVENYLPCNFEVNPITHFGVVTLFHQNALNFNQIYFKIAE